MVNVDVIWAWTWWTFMVFIGLSNLIICALIVKRYLDSRKSSSVNGFRSEKKYQQLMLTMGIIFTSIGFYRTIFVSDYGPQLAWFNTLANSSLLIRFFAIFAEMSFSGLIAFSMLKFNEYVPSPTYNSSKLKEFIEKKSPFILVICIFIAQFFATSAVITKFELLFAIEETLWSIGFLSILPLAIIQLKRILSIKNQEEIKRLQIIKMSAIIVAVWTIIYCCYGLFYHLPGMWIEEISKIQTGYPPIKTGISAVVDSFRIVNVTRAYSDWGFGFLFWHSAYFTVCVWISLFLMQAPKPKEKIQLANNKLTKTILILIAAAIIVLLILISYPLFL